jgi:bifunctional UDP-N-acetylglucosamine pyrophosphorylase / glucosamine-1-phosphate N-acetyltransferase
VVTTPLHIVVLAAGKGTRMKSARPKVLHQVAGGPMIAHVLDSARALAPQSTTVVVGHQADLVRTALAGRQDVTYVVQEPQLGTAHALLSTEPVLGGATGLLLLLSGDVPLLSGESLKKIVAAHESSAAQATVVTAVLPDPSGYGRIVRRAGAGEQIARIVEDRDASPDERGISEINAGIYVFALEGLFDALRAVSASNAQGEYYLPDIVALYNGRGRRVAALRVADPTEVLGVNTRLELAEVNRQMRMRVNEALMAAGVTIEDPATTYVAPGVSIGADTVLHPGVHLEGATVVGEGCEIHSGVRIVGSTLGDRVVVLNHCVIEQATIAADVRVGPFARLRPGADLREKSQVGNFVELKQSVLGPGSKSMHLTYLGDTSIGAGVNIGAGTIVCNYDGARKQRTSIEDGAFIGSDTQLIAPVTVGKGAYVGTGTTVREDVPPGALAVSAGKQRNIEGWADERRSAAGRAAPPRREDSTHS